MKEWKFKTFRKDSGKDAIDEWLAGLSPSARAAIKTRIRYLEAKPPENWVRPFFDKLQGHIHEIRVKDTVEKVQYRVLGCFGPGGRVFTMLIGAKEKDKKLEPSTKRTADERYKIVLKYKEGCLNDY